MRNKHHQRKFVFRSVGRTFASFAVIMLVGTAIVVGVRAAEMPGAHQSKDRASSDVVEEDFFVVRPVWPTANAKLHGPQEFRAAVDGMPLDSYIMYWNIDGSKKQKMQDDPKGQYKVASVDASAWTVSEVVPRIITYSAVTPDGKPIDSTQVEVKIVAAPTKKTGNVAGANTTSSSSASSKAIPRLPAAPITKSTANMTLYVDPNNPAARQAQEWRQSRFSDYVTMTKLAAQPQSRWFGDWTKNLHTEITNYTVAANKANKLPVLVLYNIPSRHCDSGGAANYDQYIAWVNQVASGISNRKAIIVVEPDALALISCLSPSGQTARYKALHKAVSILSTNPNAIIYIDAGHSGWIDVDDMANRLYKANIAAANGFSLNVANFTKTDSNVAYGNKLSDKLNGKHFVIDTSRNGLGPSPDNEWCNPSGRAVGPLPTTSVSHTKVDAYIWIKVPGESDGTCNGGPTAGVWWPDYALALMRHAGY